MRISDWSSDVCSSDLLQQEPLGHGTAHPRVDQAQDVRPARQLRVGEDVVDALPQRADRLQVRELLEKLRRRLPDQREADIRRVADIRPGPEVEAGETLRQRLPPRSEEHTSELQSLMRISYAVFC